MKRTPIRSMSSKRRAALHQPAVEREPRPLAHAMRAATYVGSTGEPMKKENLLRSEAYRRLVVQQPCRWCGREGFSQAAHPNHGKGMGLKVDDRRCFALCLTCHPEFDQGKRLTKQQRRDLSDAWERQTRADIVSAGRWPSNLPRWEEVGCP